MLKPLKGYGLFMYRLCEKTGLFLSKHLFLYWILMFTWALPSTLLGLIVTLFLLLCGKKPERYGHSYRFIIGKHWGGVTFGLMFIQDGTRSENTAMHEYGHVHQLILGPLWLILNGIPSATRYWYRKLSKRTDLPSYYEVWFERSASNLGTMIVKNKQMLNVQ